MNKNIKLIVFVLIGFVIFFILLNALEKKNNYLPEKVTNEIETNFKAELLYKNEIVSLQELIKNEDISVINIWASWCLPCRNEHSYLVDLKKIKNINIIGINYKDEEANAKKFLKELGNPYSEILIDTDGTKSIELGAYGIPETYLINNRTKEVIKKFIGPLNDLKFKEIIKVINNEKI